MTTAADRVDHLMDCIHMTRDAVQSALKGRMVRVISDHNGQPFGHSKHNWRGQERKIVQVYVDAYEVNLCLEGHEYECFIGADEVELL